MPQRWNQARDVNTFPPDAGTMADIQENFERLFLALKRSPLGQGVLPVPGGGTGLGDVPAGALLVGNGTNVLSLIAAVAEGFALISKGVGAAPEWGKIDLTLHVTGILPIANGGTSADNATEAFNNLSPLTTKGDVLSHNGTDNIRVPVGTDGYTLVADSAQAAGVKWAQGGGTHEILQENVHTDADTQTRVLGDLIVARAPTTLETAWIDGAPVGLGFTGVDTGGLKYWGDGAPFAGIFSGGSGAEVKWRRLPIGDAGLVLRSNGSEPEWGDPGEVDSIVAANQPKVRVYATAHKTIASGIGTDSPSFGGTRVDFVGESYDTDAFHDPVTNNARLTVPAGQGGTYLIVGQASWQTSATGRKACWLVKNNVFRLGISEVNGDDGGLNLSHTATSFAVLAAGDYVELQVRQDSGGDLLALGGVESDGLCSLAMYKLP